MNFGFTEEQELLRQEVRKFLDAHCDTGEVRKIGETPEGYSKELWKQIAELGWVGLTIPEAHGGAGLGWVDLVVLLEETGRSLFPSPLLANTIAARAIAEAGNDEQQGRWLPGLADGSTVATVAVVEASDRPTSEAVSLAGEADGDGFRLTGEKRYVLDAGNADLFVVAFRAGGAGGDLRLAIVPADAAGATVESTPSMDLSKRLGNVRFDGVAVAGENVLAHAPLERILDLATAAVTAEMVGAAEGAVQLTADFAKERIQFGKPIGQFQGVKHPLAEMYVDVESFKSLVYYAAWALDHGEPDAARAVSMAKAYASDAFARIGIDSVQLHGGVGYTWEYDAQLYLKRSKWARPIYGDATFHYERVAQLGGL
jgi:alkylation response protein AidB-like acyl-CoA dehydrogenase